MVPSVPSEAFEPERGGALAAAWGTGSADSTEFSIGAGGAVVAGVHRTNEPSPAGSSPESSEGNAYRRRSEGSVGWEPSDQELKISARLLLHIARQPRPDPSGFASEGLTQSGMSVSLRATQPAVSHALGRLVDGGLLVVFRAHVPGRGQRVKCYALTSQGEAVVEHIRTRLSA